MSHTNQQLVPPLEMSPPSIRHLPISKRIELWAQLVDESDALLVAGLKAKVGPSGNWQQAYREWYSRRMEEHDRMQVRFAENLTRRESANDK
jgi:hypothetical protein